LEKLISLPDRNPKKEESAQGSREESRGSTIQLFSTMPGNLQRRIGQGSCLGAAGIVSATIVGMTII